MFNPKTDTTLPQALLNLKKALLRAGEFYIPDFVTKEDGSYLTHTNYQFFGLAAEDTINEALENASMEALVAKMERIIARKDADDLARFKKIATDAQKRILPYVLGKEGVNYQNYYKHLHGQLDRWVERYAKYPAELTKLIQEAKEALSVYKTMLRAAAGKDNANTADAKADDVIQADIALHKATLTSMRELEKVEALLQQNEKAILSNIEANPTVSTSLEAKDKPSEVDRDPIQVYCQDYGVTTKEVDTLKGDRWKIGAFVALKVSGVFDNQLESILAKLAAFPRPFKWGDCMTVRVALLNDELLPAADMIKYHREYNQHYSPSRKTYSLEDTLEALATVKEGHSGLVEQWVEKKAKLTAGSSQTAFLTSATPTVPAIKAVPAVTTSVSNDLPSVLVMKS